VISVVYEFGRLVRIAGKPAVGAAARTPHTWAYLCEPQLVVRDLSRCWATCCCCCRCCLRLLPLLLQLLQFFFVSLARCKCSQQVSNSTCTVGAPARTEHTHSHLCEPQLVVRTLSRCWASCCCCCRCCLRLLLLLLELLQFIKLCRPGLSVAKHSSNSTCNVLIIEA